jgi:CBS-domain-containing membrane protein
MITTTEPLVALTASDLMSRDVVAIPEQVSLQAAAHLLSQNLIDEAPVVDAEGRCIGVLCAADLVHWAEEGARGAPNTPMPTCPYQVKGRLLTGEAAVICTLAEGNCPLQVMRPTTAGRHTAVCLQPDGVLTDWQRVTENLLGGAVRRCMTADVVTVEPQTPLPELARLMIDTHSHRVIVVDARRRPIGVVSSTDILAALADAGRRP